MNFEVKGFSGHTDQRCDQCGGPAAWAMGGGLRGSAAETELARQVGTELLGTERVTRQGRSLTGSEDCAFMLEHCPGSYFMIGNGAGEGTGEGTVTARSPTPAWCTTQVMTSTTTSCPWARPSGPGSHNAV